MSIEALNWAMTCAPIPRDANGKRSAPCTAVLIGLANHAGPDGRGAFPSVRRLVQYTSLSERTVQECIQRLLAVGTIVPGRPAVVAAHIEHEHSRPNPYDLCLDKVDPERGAAGAPPAAGAPRGVQQAHPSPRSRRTPGGAAGAPEPSTEPSSEPPAPDGAAATLPGMPVDNPTKAPDTAQQITAEWWLRFTPRPATPFLGQRAIVQRVLAAGWTPEQVRGALAGMDPPLAAHLLERALRGNGRRSDIHDWAGDPHGHGWGGTGEPPAGVGA